MLFSCGTAGIIGRVSCASQGGTVDVFGPSRGGRRGSVWESVLMVATAGLTAVLGFIRSRRFDRDKSQANECVERFIYQTNEETTHDSDSEGRHLHPGCAADWVGTRRGADVADQYRRCGERFVGSGDAWRHRRGRQRCADREGQDGGVRRARSNTRSSISGPAPIR